VLFLTCPALLTRLPAFLLSTCAELEGDEVEEARQLYALLRQQLAELRLSSLAVGAAADGCRWVARLPLHFPGIHRGAA
jgi:hypothetical protein